MGDVEEAVQVGGNHRIPLALVHFHKKLVPGNTGVIHQHIHPARFRFDFFHHGFAGIEIGHIPLGGGEVKTQGLLGSEPFPGLGKTRQAVGVHLEAVFGQGVAHGRSQTTHGTGHQSYFLRHDASFLVFVRD